MSTTIHSQISMTGQVSNSVDGPPRTKNTTEKTQIAGTTSIIPTGWMSDVMQLPPCSWDKVDNKGSRVTKIVNKQRRLSLLGAQWRENYLLAGQKKTISLFKKCRHIYLKYAIIFCFSFFLWKKKKSFSVDRIANVPGRWICVQLITKCYMYSCFLSNLGIRCSIIAFRALLLHSPLVG